MFVFVLCFLCAPVALASVETRLRMLEERVILDSIEFRDSIADIKLQLNASAVTAQSVSSCKCNSRNGKDTGDVAIKTLDTVSTKYVVLHGVKNLKAFVHKEIGQAASYVKTLTANLTDIGQRMSEMDSIVMQLQTTSAEMMKEHADQTDVLTKTNAYFETKIKAAEEKADGTRTILGNQHTEYLKHLNVNIEMLGNIERVLESVRNTIAVQSKQINEIQSQLGSETFMRMKAVFEFSELYSKVSCHGASCYYPFGNGMSWDGAKSECERCKAHLAIVDNDEENDIVQNLAKYICGDAHGVWIGGSDEDTEGVWKWVNGERISRSFWAQGEPNGGRQENSLAFWRSTNFRWNDAANYIEMPFICERKVLVD